MGVQVDQAGGDDLAASIDGLGAGARQVAADRGDLAVGKGDVGDLVAPVRRIDDPPAGDDQLRHGCSKMNGVSLHEPLTGGLAKRLGPTRPPSGTTIIT